MEWKNGEAGPICFCGKPTQVMITDEGEARLLCIEHTVDKGALYPLPKNKRPAHWPHLNDDEMEALTDAGFAEQHLSHDDHILVNLNKVLN